LTVARIDVDTLHDLVTREPLAVAGKQFGESGSDRVKGILRFLKRCARYATVGETSKVTVFGIMGSDPTVESLRSQHASAFQFGVTVLGSIQDLTVEIREDGSPLVWHRIPPEIVSTIETGIAYRLIQGVETFLVGGATVAVAKVIEDAVSQFLLNYFTDLKDALIAYRDSMARTSKCHLLRMAWADDNRFWFDTEPEYRLRRALHNFLYSYLRFDDIDLREEQNVDDSHPVDIKIVWRMENRTAIIEVKWIGKSIDLSNRRITASYGDARARKGAKQLAKYLEDHRQEAAKEDTRGYLVVFDCRRKKLNMSMTQIDKSNGLYYQTREIRYSPEFNKTRADFEAPIRMFLEPVCL
jgi:hypothetical protein